MKARAEPDLSLTWRASIDPPPDEWPALYAAGWSMAEIAARTNHLPTRVKIELVARGVVIRPRRQRVRP